MSDHIAQVQNVLRVLQDNGLYCQGREVPLLQVGDQVSRLIISADGLRMDPSKISAVQNWPTPKKVETCSFVRIHELLSCPDSTTTLA
ncbi:hypothetical protein BASA83_010299 [Batrachochytrium salamandrivorans]|nr:hypothetical protein BASA83_010299 [Batrachochytrium salamandrivorans]